MWPSAPPARPVYACLCNESRNLFLWVRLLQAIGDRSSVFAKASSASPQRSPRLISRVHGSGPVCRNFHVPDPQTLDMAGTNRQHPALARFSRADGAYGAIYYCVSLNTEIQGHRRHGLLDHVRGIGERRGRALSLCPDSSQSLYCRIVAERITRVTAESCAATGRSTSSAGS